MNVNDLFAMPAFENFKVIAGEKGLNHEVSTVTVMDAPDIDQWLKGGEFLLTTGYIMRDHPEQIKDLIIRIHQAGAAALGIKITRFIHELPAVVIDIAEQLQFPVIAVPHSFSFTDVIDPVLSQIVNEQAKKNYCFHIKYTNRLRISLFTVAVFRKLLKRSVVFLDAPIIYEDSYFDKVYVSDDSDLHVKLSLTYQEEMTKMYTSYPIKIDNVLYGKLFVQKSIRENTPSEYKHIAIEHASTVIKLNIQKEISNLQIESRYRDEFVQDLILNNIQSIEEIQTRALLYGWNFSGNHLVFIVDIDNFKEKYLSVQTEIDNITLEETKKQIFQDAIHFVREKFPLLVYTNFSDSIVFIIQPSADHLTKLKELLTQLGLRIRKAIANKYPYTLTIGVGLLKHSPIDISVSYSEAKKAVKMSRMMYKQNTTSFYDDLGVFKLFENASPEMTRDFYLSYLQDVISHDQTTNGQLMLTLEAIIQHDWNLKAAAESIFVHYNTIKYRFQKIGDLLGKDFKNNEDKVNISIAMMLYRLNLSK